MRCYLPLLVASCFVAVYCEKPLICYWDSWSVGRDAPFKHSVDLIPLDLCTHVIYSFAILDQATYRIAEKDVGVDKPRMKDLLALKQKNPNLKVTLAVGGAGEGVYKFSTMAADPSKRRTFIDSVVSWMKEYGWDGLDMDWEFPGQDDKSNLSMLLKELRAAFDQLTPRRMLTIAVNIVNTPGYDVPEIVKHVDFIHAMSYDLRGTWNHFTDNHAILNPPSNDIAPGANVRDGMQHWVDLGAPASKLIMGIALYGKSFTVDNAANNGLRVPANNFGKAGRWTQEAGALAYYEICQNILNGWTSKFDDKGKVPYAYSGDQFVGYEDVQGIKYKTDEIKRKGYGGAMVWAISEDDFIDKCGGGKYPLTRAIKAGLGGGNIPTPKPTGRPGPTTHHPHVTTAAPTPRPNPTPNQGCSDPNELNIAHTKYCNKYFQCSSGNAIEMDCSVGLVYQHSINNCNWADAVMVKEPPNCVMA